MEWLYDINTTRIIDLIVVCILLYYVYKLLKNTVVVPIFIGIAVIFLVHQLTAFLQLTFVTKLFGFVVNGGAIVILIIFQPEIRKFLSRLGTVNRLSFRRTLQLLKINTRQKINHSFYASNEFKDFIEVIKKFSKDKTGALIVWEQTQPLDDIIKSEYRLDATISKLLLQNIFFKNAPLHDGAVVINHKKIKGASVVLPLSSKNLPFHLGTRHQAAIGASESYDCVVVAVSEETGSIHIAVNGDIKKVSPENFEKRMTAILKNS